MHTKITLDLDRVLEFADPDETLVEFAKRVKSETLSGISYVWTQNAANVGVRA